MGVRKRGSAPKKSAHSIRVYGFHGCDKYTGEGVLEGKLNLLSSRNDYDWLGPGIYFWKDNPERALEWAREQKQLGKIKEPFVLGAVIDLGLCLNVNSPYVAAELREAHNTLAQMMAAAGFPMPENHGERDGVPLLRDLDNDVISLVHLARKKQGKPCYDTVLGAFEEGKPIYPGSAIREKTHTQIAVVTEKSVVRYFDPSRLPKQIP